MKLLQFFADFLKEKEGKPSIKRLIMITLTIIFAFAYMRSSIHSDNLVEIPQGWLILFLGMLGIMAASYSYKNKR